MGGGAAGHNFPAWCEDADWRVRLGTAAALARHGAAHAPCKPQVRTILFDDAANIRKLASTTLANTGHENIMQSQVYKLLKSDDWRERTGALEALSRQGIVAAEYGEEVAMLLTDSKAEVRIAASAALRRMGRRVVNPVADALLAASADEVPAISRLLYDLAAGEVRLAERWLQEADTRTAFKRVTSCTHPAIDNSTAANSVAP